MLSNGPELDPEKTARYAGQIHKLEDQVARYVTSLVVYCVLVLFKKI